jgi:DNA repair photolyase
LFCEKKSDLVEISKNETVKALRSFIEGNRNNETNWCDWNIPLHWGGCSDPFQPIEKEYKSSLECLKVFAETQYPFIVSTKGRIIVEPEYLDLIKKCNCVIQISAVCSEYDKLEEGAPPFEGRLEMIKKLSEHKRTIVRIQPYMAEVHNSIMRSIKRFAECGAYGIIVEGMKFLKSKKGLEKVGGDICYPLKVLEPRFKELKLQAHKYGLKFYSGENRLRSMGDSLCCCGIDGLDGFTGNRYNINHFENGDVGVPSPTMCENGTGKVFHSISQKAGEYEHFKNSSFSGLMKNEYIEKRNYYDKVFGKTKK